MAQVVLGAIGGAVGGGVGRIVGATLGGVIDRGVVGALQPARQRGPRLESLRVQSSADGAPMAAVFGRARVTGQVIWAARFLETRHESGGGKGGPRTVDHAYSLSFAVAICEGLIDGVGRVWADGQPLDLTGVTMRVHRGTGDQTPDPLIEAVEGHAPAYRGTAYAVFEDLALGPFGNRVPQLGFEVFRRPDGDGLEERLEGVCLIPGAGEFGLATEVVVRREGLTRTAAENVHHAEGRPDILVSLDQLEAQCPNLKRVSLVVGWFGDDLRAGHCRVKPGVERREKPTEPQIWSVAGLDRETAHLISEVDGRPAYGGTPSDVSVRQAVAALKARGWAVTLYPFVFMDVPADNDSPDPYGRPRQPPYPWRGRIKGEDGAGAAAQVGSLFGGAADWGLRRLALHYAGLAAETGCDGLLIGSEMRGLTWTRDAGGGHPAVNQYRTLAAECRAITGPDVTLSYAADWSEYFGFQPGDGTVTFHLDPLWADAEIHFAGPANNPVSAIYGGPMLAAVDAWCWDARPYPAFPALGDLWADAGAWWAGHWLNGRLTGDTADLLAAILRRGGLSDDQFAIGTSGGEAQGYVIDRPMRTRDALEPLLGAFGMVGAERDGKVALVGAEAAGLTLMAEALALPDETASLRTERVLEARPGAVRVRFIDEGADYQTGSATVRSDGDGVPGSSPRMTGVDLDLPAVCGRGLAEGLARRVLAGSEAEDRLTAALGPLEALRLEPGDVVTVEGRAGDWRVERLRLDEMPTAVLERVVDVVIDDGGIDWRPGEAPSTAGAPWLRVLDLPPLPGHEDDDRPIAAVAVDPWRPMRVFAGPTAEALTARGTAQTPARVGVLTQPLGPGVLYRWDEANTVVVRVEGPAPASLTEVAVLAGANAMAVETSAGWEIVQFRSAMLAGSGVWRLSGLLRGQQGTEGEMAAGAPAGAMVVFLDEGLARVTLSRSERGLPLIWRAGPLGAPPGGPGFAVEAVTLRGLHDRSWRPAHLQVRESPAGPAIRWSPRVRLYGDVWDGEPVEVDPRRFRIRVLDGPVEKRVFEAEGLEALYPAAQVAVDFPDGPGPYARIAVAQWSAVFGWGVEAEAAL